MPDSTALLAIDQGTTSSRAILFGVEGAAHATAQQEFGQIYPAEGWVEHDPDAIWGSTLAVAREAIERGEAIGHVPAAIGLTNQRETTLIWDRQTGKPIHNAIVWQDRRTAELCGRLARAGLEEELRGRTGLLLDPYFSVTKIAWLLDHVDGARTAADRGELCFGTVDSFLVWRLTGGRVHATDVTNASRTGLLNLQSLDWDDELLRLFKIPRALLPEIRDCADDFGETDRSLFNRVMPIAGVAGDQQAATIGQCCFSPGAVKCTFGTGAFILMNTGDAPRASANRLLTTVAYRIAGRTAYALEGAIFVAGAAVQWLRDGLGIIRHAAETESLAAGLEGNGGVYLVPAFTGLGAPHWDPAARGAMFGLTRGSGRAHLARAALESVAYQTLDLVAAMAEDGLAPQGLRVDGGMVSNDWMVQFLADILGQSVDRPAMRETTAAGAAYLAGLKMGVYPSLEEVERQWGLERRFEPAMAAETRSRLVEGWRDAVARVKTEAASAR